MRPLRAVAIERRGQQIQPPAGSKPRLEDGVLDRVDRPRGRWGIREEQEPEEGHLRDRGRDGLRGIEHARSMAGATESRASRIRGAVAERREQQILQVTTFRRDGRLAFLEQLLEPRLLGQGVDNLHGRHDVLGLDDAPASAGEPPRFNRERAGRPGSQRR